MKTQLYISGLVSFLCLISVQTTFSQVITNVPTTRSNTRFLDEVYSSVTRPGLSVIGFDNGGDYSKGKGLKQILNEIYVPKGETNESKELFIKEVLKISNENILLNPPSATAIELNSNRLQYLALETLSSYVLERV